MELDYISHTKTKSGNISVTENKVTCIFENKLKIDINEIHVDNGLISSQTVEKCDYIVYWESDNSFVYYIELKGSDVSKAYSQILSTIKLTENKFEDFNDKNCVIVCSSYPQENSTIQRYKLLLKKKGFKLQSHTREARIEVKKAI